MRPRPTLLALVTGICSIFCTLEGHRKRSSEA